jgi:hypothetical protein
MSWFRKPKPAPVATAAPAANDNYYDAWEGSSVDAIELLSIYRSASRDGIGRAAVKKALDHIDKLQKTDHLTTLTYMLITLNNVSIVKKILNKAQQLEIDITPSLLKTRIADKDISDEIKAVLQDYLDHKDIQSPRAEADMKEVEAELKRLTNDQDPTDDLEDFLKEMVKDMGEGAQPDLLAPGDKYPELYKALKCLDPKKASNLPPGWVAKVSTKSGKTYYEKNGKSQWNKPTAGGRRRTMNRRKHAKKTRRNRK